jgi:hypothetical protein
MSGSDAKPAQVAPSAGIVALIPEDISRMAIRMRGLAPIEPVSAAKTLSEIAAAWRDRAFAPRRATVSAIAAAWGYSELLLEASLDALLAPFTDAALTDFASAMAADRKVKTRGSGIISRKRAGRIIGMVMPGNLPGAGLHEVLLGLLSGRALMLKTSAREPLFFGNFARSIAQFDRALAGRIVVFNWSREREDLTTAMRARCDWLAAFGGDETLRALERTADGANEEAELANAIANAPLDAGFGERFSGAYISAEPSDVRSRRPATESVARDVTLFEQAGCLSPHHIFVEEELSEHSAHGRAYQFARELASELGTLATILPPPGRLGLETAAALRRVREAARWRMLGGEAAGLWEGPNLSWAVIYDEGASFTPSPGFRTITVSPVRNLRDLADRLGPVAGRLEAFAVAGSGKKLISVKEYLGKLGVAYFCAPGVMQSPPLEWRHGGGAFLDAMR